MPEPILFVVDDDAATLDTLAAVLERRFGADYRILTDVSPASALARIEQACRSGEKVALVVTGVWAAGSSGPEWLVPVREPFPGARRGVRGGFVGSPADPAVRRAPLLRPAAT